jgi:hypothetical protein
MAPCFVLCCDFSLPLCPDSLPSDSFSLEVDRLLPSSLSSLLAPTLRACRFPSIPLLLLKSALPNYSSVGAPAVSFPFQNAPFLSSRHLQLLFGLSRIPFLLLHLYPLPPTSCPLLPFQCPVLPISSCHLLPAQIRLLVTGHGNPHSCPSCRLRRFPLVSCRSASSCLCCGW